MRLSLPTKDVQKKSDYPPRHLRHTSPLAPSACFDLAVYSPHMHTRPGHIHGSTPSSVSISANRLACCASASSVGKGEVLVACQRALNDLLVLGS